MKLSNTALSVIIIVLWVGIAAAVISPHAVPGGIRAGAAVLPGALAALTNGDRVAANEPALADNQLLDEAAQMKANDMATRGYYGHTSPEGWLPFHWLQAVGYTYLNVGENLDLVYSGTDATVNSDWMNSPEHRTNILLPQFTEAGIGVASGVYEGDAVTFVVELFATPMPVPVAASTAPVASVSAASLFSPSVPVPIPMHTNTATSVASKTLSATRSVPAVPASAPSVTPAASSAAPVVTANVPVSFHPPTAASFPVVGTSTTGLRIAPVGVTLPNLFNSEVYLQAFHTAFVSLTDTLRQALAHFGVAVSW